MTLILLKYFAKVKFHVFVFVHNSHNSLEVFSDDEEWEK
jgi:hypothetical protein